ncbi:FAD/NAD(P)-binding protein [Rhizobium tumorigenes]|uniref:FAD/NAD(P)-binding protein n=1 Tax=Rhizobium tumorigenes TaxID=2041385 RepID=UPI00241F22D0|nr:FAD/NAD(P)-binding protein [Rhizobium tumorigenes]WFS04468.1 FAD/NAD(P)-binding protein [Rhizobium tumorigenes]
MTRIAIIGSGPTGIYTLKGLVGSSVPLSITIFEIEPDPGKGTPYHPALNDQAMLSNIASIELPPICETLVAWLRRQTDAGLERLHVLREAIDEREFYPRVVLGEYLQAQFSQLVQAGTERGHRIDIKPRHRVIDIALQVDDIALVAQRPDGTQADYGFDHVVMATGHDWPDNIEIKPGYFMSPWPAVNLKSIGNCAVGILGTSLSAIDAMVTVATAHGAFYVDASGLLEYQQAAGSEGFGITMMSRKGLLPEADFYHEIPYLPLQFCTKEAIDTLLATGRGNLLDDIFDLFKAELLASDPEYSATIGLSLRTIETIGPAYFAERESRDPFAWAALNLAEAARNKQQRHTVPWRYAILRMHEAIARAVPQLDSEDLKRFHKHFKSIFIDDYATVPHESIKRILALRRAGKLDIVALGDEYEIDNERVERGAEVTYDGKTLAFGAFIDATGQHPLSVRDIPFPTLLKQGVIRKAATSAASSIILPGDHQAVVRTGGIDLDDAFRPRFESPVSNKLYCAAISFLLHKLPFVQGITSANDIGGVVSAAILADSMPAGAIASTPELLAAG